MNQEIKERWAAALESGEYPQGDCALNQYGQFCCLGVLCDLHSKETNTKWGIEDEKTSLKSYLENDGFLPDKVQEWADLGNQDPYLSSLGVSASVANDKPISFSDIAKAIRTDL